MNLGLYSSVLRRDTPNLVGVQDGRLDFLPTVLVCPFRPAAERTGFRVHVEWKGNIFIVCPDLTRPVRRTGLRLIDHLGPRSSEQVIQALLRLLPQ